MTDRNIRVGVGPAARHDHPSQQHSRNHHHHHHPELLSGGAEATSESHYQPHIVYDSQKQHIVPYPDGEIIR